MDDMKAIKKMMNLSGDYIICELCERELPNKTYIKENGCLWCDFKNKERNDG